MTFVKRIVNGPNFKPRTKFQQIRSSSYRTTNHVPNFNTISRAVAELQQDKFLWHPLDGTRHVLLLPPTCNGSGLSHWLKDGTVQQRRPFVDWSHGSRGSKERHGRAGPGRSMWIMSASWRWTRLAFGLARKQLSVVNFKTIETHPLVVLEKQGCARLRVFGMTQLWLMWQSRWLNSDSTKIPNLLTWLNSDSTLIPTLLTWLNSNPNFNATLLTWLNSDSTHLSQSWVTPIQL